MNLTCRRHRANAEPTVVHHKKIPTSKPAITLYTSIMTLVLGHISSLECWLAPSASGLKTHAVSASFRLPATGPSAQDVHALCNVMPRTFSHPLHVMVSEPVKHRRAMPLASHVVRTEVPRSAFRNLRENLFACSVEMTFVQMAGTIDIVDLIRLGFEICGSYTIDPDSPHGFFEREPLTTVSKLRAFIDRAPRMKGRTAALRATRYILENAASPAETRLAMTLFMPRNLGGFGLPRPVLNHRIDLSRRDRKISGRRFFKCDIYWPSHRLGVEYDSDLAHTGSARIAADATRKNTLTLAGSTIATVTKAQYANHRELSEIARAIARRLGADIRPRCSDYERKQQALREKLRHQPPWVSHKQTHAIEQALSL